MKFCSIIGVSAPNFNTFCYINITCVSVALCYHPVHFVCSVFPSNFAPNALIFMNLNTKIWSSHCFIPYLQ